MSDYVPEKGHRVKVTTIGEVVRATTDHFDVVLDGDRGARRFHTAIDATVERLPDPERWQPGDVVRDAKGDYFTRRPEDADNSRHYPWAEGAWSDEKVHLGEWATNDQPVRPLTRLVPETQQPEHREPKVGDTVRITGNRRAGGPPISDFVGRTATVESGPDSEGDLALRVPDGLIYRLPSEVEVIDVPEQPVYRVGDPDPTPPSSPEMQGKRCRVMDPGTGWSCHWPKGHDHPQHVFGSAGTGLVAAVWPVDGAS